MSLTYIVGRDLFTKKLNKRDFYGRQHGLSHGNKRNREVRTEEIFPEDYGRTDAPKIETGK